MMEEMVNTLKRMLTKHEMMPVNTLTLEPESLLYHETVVTRESNDMMMLRTPSQGHTHSQPRPGSTMYS